MRNLCLNTKSRLGHSCFGMGPSPLVPKRSQMHLTYTIGLVKRDRLGPDRETSDRDARNGRSALRTLGRIHVRAFGRRRDGPDR